MFLLQLPFATYLLEAILEKINEKKRLVEEYFTVMKDTRWYYDWELFFRSENFMWWSENMHCSSGTVSAPAINRVNTKISLWNQLIAEQVKLIKCIAI